MGEGTVVEVLEGGSGREQHIPKGCKIFQRSFFHSLGLVTAAPLAGYLLGAPHDERGELGHHQVHAFQTGRGQFADLLFHDGLEGQVRREEPRSEVP